MKFYFDGGCKPNPGTMEVGVVDEDGGFFHEEIGHGTNNIAEWAAFLYTLDIAKARGLTDIEVVGDSALVVNQANGSWACRAKELQPFLAEYHVQRKHFRSIRISHVRRAQNLAGIALEKRLKGG